MEGDDFLEEIPDKKDAMRAVETLVRYIEKDSGELREGLVDTPKRVIESFNELYNGYSQNADTLLDAIQQQFVQGQFLCFQKCHDKFGLNKLMGSSKNP